MLAMVTVVFALTYVGMLVFARHRLKIVWGACLVFLVLGVLSWQQALSAVDWNVLLMLTGMMGMVYLFMNSGMPAHLGDRLLKKSGNVRLAVVALSLFAGVISAFIDNVATVLMIAPVALAISKKLQISPVPVIISIAVSSNLQGAATLVGDTTSILLGGYAGLDFLDFFWMKGRPGIFFAVELGALITIPVLLLLFRRHKTPVPDVDLTPVSDPVPTVLLCLAVLSLIGASFLPHRPALTNGMICLFFCLVGVARQFFKTRRKSEFRLAARAVDWQTLGLLAGLFVLIEGITQAGLIDRLSHLLAQVGGGSPTLLYLVIVVGSVVCSAFVDNIPFVAAMLPVVSGMAGQLGVPPELFYFGLLSGATLGGNLTPIGASANITGIGLLRREGYDVSVRDFCRIGVPFTLAAVSVGAGFLYLFWR